MGVHLIWRLGIVLIVMLGIGGCAATELCLSNQHAVQVSFVSTYQNTDTTLKSVSIYGLGRTDSIYSSQSLSKVFLPLSFDNEPDTTSFVIKVKDDTDIIRFVHRKELDFISGECGYVFKFTLDTVLTSRETIDKALIVYPTIKYGEDVQNVTIYIY
jgi:hypothetical protein